MPMTNIVILLFIIAMAYFGTVYGLFSAFMHLLIVIAVGAIAFALWEPITLGLLMGYVPLIAWTIGLIVPFGVLLLVFRMVIDKLVPRDAQFMSLVNTLAGAFCGVVSGVLTSGIVIIGLCFLPFGPEVGGFQPYTIGGGGVVMDRGEGGLWIPVHRITANFYSGLSAGAFASSTPMAQYMPDLEEQMVTVRMRPDGVSIVAAPDAVEVTSTAVAQASALIEANADPAVVQALGSDFNKSGSELVIIETSWETKAGTVDEDRKLRIPTAQVRLVTGAKGMDGQDTDMIGAAGFTVSRGGVREFYSYEAVELAEAPTPAKFSWVFIVPEGREARFLMIRKLRINLPEGDAIVTNKEEVLAALGAPPVPAQEGEDGEAGGDEVASGNAGGSNVGENTGRNAGTEAEGYEITNRLPQTMSKNAASGLSYTTNAKDESVILSGSTGSARKTQGNPGQRSRVTAFDVPDHEAMVRIKIEFTQSQSIFAGGMAGAAALNPIFLKDIDGNQIYISAWVWLKENKDQDIHYDAFQTLRSGKELPITRMNRGDEFYLYFNVTKPRTIVSYNIGNEAEQVFDPPIDVR